MRKIVSCAVILCGIVFMGVNAGAQEPKKILFIHVTGSTGDTIDVDKGLRIDNWVAKRLQDLVGGGQEFSYSTYGRAFSFKTYPAYGQSPETTAFNIREIKKTIFPKNDNIIIEVGMNYLGGDVYKWTRTGSYPQEVEGLFNVAGDFVVKLVREFRAAYPHSHVEALSVSIGCNVIIKAIENGVSDFDNIMLCSPPITDEAAFNKLLLDNGYDNSRVTVFSIEDDPNSPLNLQGGRGSAFNLVQ